MSLDQNLEFNKICRLCMSRDNVLTSIFSSQLNSNLSFSDMIMCITTLNIKTNDGLPDSICVKCIDKILKAYSFKIECEKSEKVLLDYLEKKVSNENACKSNDVPRNIIKDSKKRKYAPFNLSEELNQVGFDKINEKLTSQTEAKILKCIWCDYAVLTEDTLKRHIASKHHKSTKTDSNDKDELSIPTNKCRFCQYVFENEQNLKKHLEAKHLNKLDIANVNQISGACNLCGLYSKNITLHLNEHYKHLYCNKCKMKFDDKLKFEVHMKEEMLSSNSAAVTEGQNITSSHTESKSTSYSNYCGKVFTQVGLKNHARVQCGEKPYKCTKCCKSYTSNAKLKTHMRLHDDNNNLYNCDECGESFKKAIKLKHHNLVHAGQHPIQCKICNKEFHNISQLNEHLKKHTKESRRHSCDQCDKSFASFESLKSHLYIHE